jgi:hypothetical protein
MRCPTKTPSIEITDHRRVFIAVDLADLAANTARQNEKPCRLGETMPKTVAEQKIPTIDKGILHSSREGPGGKIAS